MKQGYKNCDVKTINTQHLDNLVRAIALDYLKEHASLSALSDQEPQIRDMWLRQIISRVNLSATQMTVQLDAAEIEKCQSDDELNRASSDNGNDNANAVPITLYAPDVEQQSNRITLTLNVQIKRLDGKRILLSPDGHDLVMPTKPEPKQHLVQAIGQAYHWYERLRRENLSISAFAKALEMSDGRIHKLLPLTWLAPDILKRALAGELPPSFTLNDLLAAAEHLDWHAQRRYLSLPQLDQFA